jgi:hypothetical protein
MPSDNVFADRDWLSEFRVAGPKWGEILNEYMLSEDWARHRQCALDLAGWKCQECGDSLRGLMRYCCHRHFKTVGNEKAKDLIVLCEGCYKSRRLSKELGL